MVAKSSMRNVLKIPQDRHNKCIGYRCRGYLLNVGVRQKFISRVIKGGNIFTSEIYFGNMIYYDHE